MVIEVELENGELVIEDVQMTAWGVSVEENELLSSLAIAPNPSQGAFRMSLDQNNEQIDVEVRNFSGQIIDAQQWRGNVLEFGEQYAPGVYFVNLSQNGNSLITKKIVKY